MVHYFNLDHKTSLLKMEVTYAVSEYKIDIDIYSITLNHTYLIFLWRH